MNDAKTSFFVLIAFCAGFAHGGDFPKPQGRVSDFAGILSVEGKSACLDIIQRLEAATGSELAVVTVLSLNGDPIEDYANRLFREWGLGKKGKDNGVLVLVAVQDHRMRIEVGYGLEPILPDGLAGEIIRQEMRPAFKRGDYDAGIRQALQRIADIVERNQTVSPEDVKRLESPRSGIEWLPLKIKILLLLFFACFVGIGAFMLGAGLGSKVGVLILFGVFFGGIPCLMSLAFPIPHNVLPFFGLAMAVWGLWKGRSSPKTFRNASSQGTRTSGWIMGGSSGGSSGSSGGGGSDDFGGGSSGGGGASGSW